MESKIVKVVPHMYKGEHETFTNKYNKKNWKFDIEFEDGNKGIAFGMSNNFKYKAGDLVSFTMNENDYGKTFLGLKLIESPNGNSNKSSWNDPVIVKKMARSEGWELAIQFCLMRPIPLGEAGHKFNTVEMLKDTFYEFIVKESPDRDVCSRRYFALKHAIELMQFPNLKIETRNDIIKYAEIELEDLKMIDKKNEESNELL